jgi:hypothetical protein
MSIVVRIGLHRPKSLILDVSTRSREEHQEEEEQMKNRSNWGTEMNDYSKEFVTQLLNTPLFSRDPAYNTPVTYTAIPAHTHDDWASLPYSRGP